MSWSHSLQAALERAEHQASQGDLVEIAWMLSGFPAAHNVRRHAAGLPRIQSLMRTQRPCRCEITTILRVATHRTTSGAVGMVANGVHALLCAQTGIPVQPLPADADDCASE